MAVAKVMEHSGRDFPGEYSDKMVNSGSEEAFAKVDNVVLRTSSFSASSSPSFSRQAAPVAQSLYDPASRPPSPPESPAREAATRSLALGLFSHSQETSSALSTACEPGVAGNCPGTVHGCPRGMPSSCARISTGRRPCVLSEGSASVELVAIGPMPGRDDVCTPRSTSGPCMLAASACLEAGQQLATPTTASSPWADVPDDILRTVLGNMPPAYVRVARLVCKGWAAAAGRLMTSLKPESLDGAALAARFPYLRALDLSHCLHSVTFHTQMALQLSSNVTDALVGQLAPLANLRELSLRGCTSLSGSPTSGFAQLTALSRLESLDLSNCDSLKDDAMEVVARMRALKQLRIVGCTQLTDGALAQLARLPRLTHLDIGCNIHFSDSGIASLAAVASLQHVSLMSLALLTNEGVLALGVLPSLARITLSRCPLICEAGLQEALAGKQLQLRIFMCGAPLRRSMVGWMASVLADLDNLLLIAHH